MASPVVNNNQGAAITANGTYCTIVVPGFITGVPATTVQPQFWECSYFILAGSTGVGTVVTFQSEANDGSWSNLASPAAITVASGTTYNSTIQAPVGGLRIVVSGLVGNGIQYAQLAGIEVPIVSGGGQATTTGPKAPPAVVQTVKSTIANGTFSTVAQAYAANVTAGNTLVAFVDWADAVSTISNVHDSLNAANWTRAGNVIQGNACSCAIYYLSPTLSGACTATLTMTAGTPFPEIAIIEVSALSGVVDAAASATGTSNTPDPGALVTTVANDFLLSGVVTSTAVTAGAGGNWVLNILTTSGTGFQYLNAQAAGSYDGSFTGGSPAWCAAAAAFRSK